MRHGRWVAIAAVLALVLSILSVSATPGSAVAHPPDAGKVTITLQLVRVQDDPDLPAPEPGAAIANVIGYDFENWAYIWKCSFAGWDSIPVSWTCQLRLQIGTVLSSKSGQFGGGSWDPGPWYYFIDPLGVCVTATAWYTSYPGQSDSSQKCKL